MSRGDLLRVLTRGDGPRDRGVAQTVNADARQAEFLGEFSEPCRDPLGPVGHAFFAAEYVAVSSGPQAECQELGGLRALQRSQHGN